MKILYFYRVPLPSPRADAVQIIQTCAAISRAGASVSLHVETAGGRSTREILDYYGAAPPEEPEELEITALGSHWSWPFLTMKTSGTFRPATEARWLFLREVRPYVPGLMDRARKAGIGLLFEAHNVSASLVREKESRSGEGGRAGQGSAARERLEREILRRADGLICTQKATLEQLTPLVRQGTPSIVLGNGTRLPPESSGGARDIEILYCGSLKPWKGVDNLVAAMQSLHPYTLTIVGPGAPEDIARLKAMSLALGVRERVVLKAPVTPAQVWDLYSRARVGVIPLPSGGSVEARDFTSPLKLFEMLAAGLPVVASKLPSLEQYIENGREAILVPPDDPQFLAYGIKRVLTEEGLAGKLAAAARERAGSFTWTDRGRKLVEFATAISRRPS